MAHSKISIEIDQNGKKTEREIEISENETYAGLLKKLGINEETVLVFNNKKPVPYDDVIDGGKIQILKVVFDQ
ncbi:MoaD/ThiS family protein [Methanolapillus ohkumae]|uniref:MoaD/ThiS family protein n=1 Tax=Methanolapillus ohkumae TaxID=3028298 RepID=UPI0030B8E756